MEKASDDEEEFEKGIAAYIIAIYNNVIVYVEILNAVARKSDVISG
jgi:hypothetical protein